MAVNPLNKINKLKRFSVHVSETLREQVLNELRRVDCLFNGDIYTRRDMWEKLDAIANCASLVEIRKYEDGETVVHNANFCHNPVVCPVCADRVSKRRKAIFAEPLKRAVRRFAVDENCLDWKRDYPRGYTGVYMATATIRDGDNLRERIDTLLDSLKRFRKMGQKRKNSHSRGEWSKVRAGLSNVEIKIGSGSNNWHVHAHFLIFTDAPLNYNVRDSIYKYPLENGIEIPVSKFNYEWYTATKGEGINFDLKPVQFRAWVNGQECKTFEESVRAQAAEILKYNTLLTPRKGTGLLKAMQYLELIQRRGNRRLFNAIGLLRCDKRNPESFTTITERELRHLEYVADLDKKTYEIFASKWQNGGTYGEPIKQDGAVFSNSDDMKTQYFNLRRRVFMAQTAKYQGEYRKERNGLFKSRSMHVDKNLFENLLNGCRDFFRNRVNALWEKYDDINFLPEFLTDFNSGGLMEYRNRVLKIS
jgi:hypothetical protein